MSEKFHGRVFDVGPDGFGFIRVEEPSAGQPAVWPFATSLFGLPSRAVKGMRVEFDVSRGKIVAVRPAKKPIRPARTGIPISVPA